MNDDAIRSVLSPLRGDSPRPDVERLVSRGRRARAARKRSRSLALGAATAMAAGVVAAGLPAGDEPLTARSVLNAAAAAAADQPPEKLTGIRYVRIQSRLLEQPGWGTEQDRYQRTRRLEFWTPRGANARVEYSAGEVLDLAGNPIEPPAGTPGGGSYKGHLQFNFGGLDVERLPRDPAAAAEAMEAVMRKVMEERGVPVRDERMTTGLVARFAIDLLSFASMTPEQRATVLQVLARLPGGRATADDTVELEGALGTIGETEHTTLVIDRRTGALRSLTTRVVKPYEFRYAGPPGHENDRDGMAPRTLEYTWTYEVSRDVDAEGDRPS